jgi:hypothetical protein
VPRSSSATVCFHSLEQNWLSNDGDTSMLRAQAIHYDVSSFGYEVGLLVRTHSWYRVAYQRPAVGLISCCSEI